MNRTDPPSSMPRRRGARALLALALSRLLPRAVSPAHAAALAPALAAATGAQAASTPTRADKLVLSDAQWKQRLTPAQYRVLREEGTEPAGTSPLDKEKRRGTYHCAGCDLALFTSEMKFDSGTGWPSFFTTLPDTVGTKTDYKLIYPRKEYHCARCGGHQGHVFDDGPRPTRLRYCNNGVALRFQEAQA